MEGDLLKLVQIESGAAVDSNQSASKFALFNLAFKKNLEVDWLRCTATLDSRCTSFSKYSHRVCTAQGHLYCWPHLH